MDWGHLHINHNCPWPSPSPGLGPRPRHGPLQAWALQTWAVFFLGGQPGEPHPPCPPPRIPPPTKNLAHKNAACHSTTPQYRRVYNSTTMEECKWHHCWLKPLHSTARCHVMRPPSGQKYISHQWKFIIDTPMAMIAWVPINDNGNSQDLVQCIPTKHKTW